jgi:hypothetical protein
MFGIASAKDPMTKPASLVVVPLSAQRRFRKNYKNTKHMKIKQSTTAVGRAFGGVLALAAAAVLLPGSASAVIINLTAVPTSDANKVTTSDGVVWSQTTQQPTGTGVIDPFLRMQASSSAIEEGYNTSATPRPMDDLSTSGSGNNYVHDVLFSTMDTSGGFIKLLLDANQTGSQGKITLSKLIIWLVNTPANGDANNLNQLRNQLGAPAYDMDASLGNSQVNLAVQTSNGFNANNGSGSGDLYVNIPLSALKTSGTYFVLYSEFGDGTNPNYTNNDGFEEWAFIAGPQQTVPDGGSTLVLLGSALTGLSLIASRRKLARNA